MGWTTGSRRYFPIFTTLSSLSLWTTVIGPKLGLCPRGHWVHRDIAAVLNMLRKAADELKEYGEVVRRALDAVDEKTLEEWTALILHTERPAVLTRASPMTQPGEAVNPAGLGRQ